MKRYSSLVLISGLTLLVSSAFAACTSTGVPGDGVTSDGYVAPAPLSPVDRTENMRTEYRDWIR